MKKVLLCLFIWIGEKYFNLEFYSQEKEISDKLFCVIKKGKIIFSELSKGIEKFTQKLDGK